MVNLNKIREIAKEKKITMRKLAFESGVSEPGLYQLIRNNSTTLDTLAKIAEVLDVDIRIFFETEEETKQRKAGNKIFLAFEIDKEHENKIVKMVMGKDFIKLIQSK
ncbi:MAG: helix-turn-helix transcriptional regulator [Lentimicrobiaceae bacterium]|nr:helix-turn-helix transcriptional regulator [Lentimicrobiaceae bacterium]